MAIRTSNSSLYAPFEINKIIGKKIANLLAAELETKPRRKRPRKIKACESLYDGIDENAAEEQIEEDEEVQIEEGDDASEVANQFNYDHSDDNKEEERNEEQDVEYMQNEDTEEINQLNYEQKNKSVEVIHAIDIAPTEDFQMVINDDDIPYYVLNMPDLTDTLNWSFNDI